MYAVIQTGGKQFRVQEGDVLRVPTLATEAGKKISFDQVLLVGEGDAVKVGAEAAKTSVSADVLSHGRGPKIEIFKKRRRKHSQRTQGHRQGFTSVRITGIGAAKKAAAPKAEEKPVEAKKAAEPKAEAKPAAKKPAAKKAAAPKAATAKAEAKPAAKKPAAKKAAAKSEDKE